MDCNKDEAARAIRIAELKMKAGDFVVAQRFVEKAQRLYPDLENIVQMITICDVHCSANKKIYGLDNWYAILQVQHFADAIKIKKQYRKLALLLHPDKNKFSGAETAFKLVGEAFRLLSDQMKRSQYDVRLRLYSAIANRQSNANSGRHCTAADNTAENVAADTFWTCCKHCGQRYKYLREYINSVMHCSYCKRSYIACVTVSDGVPPSSSTAGEGVHNTSQPNTGVESRSSAAEMDKNGRVGEKLNKKNQENEKMDRKHKKDDQGCKDNGDEGVKSQKGETVKEPETGAAKSMPDLSASKNQAAKKSVEESTKSFEVDGSDVAGDNTDTKENRKRKSSRKKRQVSNAERRRDGDFVSPLRKKTRSGRVYGNVAENEVKEAETGSGKSVPDLSASKKKQAAKKKRKFVEESTKSFSEANTDTKQNSKRKSSPQADGGSDGDFVSPPTKKTRSGCEFESDSNAKQMAEGNTSPELAESGVSPASSQRKAKQNVNSENEESEGCEANGEDSENEGSEGCEANGEDWRMSTIRGVVFFFMLWLCHYHSLWD